MQCGSLISWKHGNSRDLVKAALAQDGALIAMQAGAHEPYSVVWPDNYSGTFAL